MTPSSLGLRTGNPLSPGAAHAFQGAGPIVGEVRPIDRRSVDGSIGSWSEGSRVAAMRAHAPCGSA